MQVRQSHKSEVHRPSTLRAWLLAAAAVAWCGGAQNAAAADKKPTFEAVAAAVRKECETEPGWKPAHIISQGQVTKAFAALAKLGWQAPNEKTILDRVPGDDDYLVRQLRTTAGRKFMDQIAKYPLGYDRLERLTALPRGKQMAHDLIHDKGGYKMIEYMTTTEGGKNMGRMLGKTPHGADFNKPLGKLFTLADLEAELQKAHSASATPQR